MMDGPSVSGPSKPRRQEAALADRIVALQRRNAAAPGPSRVSSRRADQDEYDRGPERGSRALYDPARPSAILARPELRDEGERPRRPIVEARPLEVRRGDVGAKKLFNPDIHDPHQFRPRQHPPPTSGPSQDTPHTSYNPSTVYALSESSGLARPLARRNISSRTPEEEADKERERRRRREGSERGSTGVSATGSRRRDREGDVKSKGSRSSDGSESLKDRERGKARGDNGVKAILKGIHDKIRNLEVELQEKHRQLVNDLEGVSPLEEKTRGSYIKPKEGETEDIGEWIGLIGRHKELADLHHRFLVRVFDPLVPSTFQQLAVKYNIPSRLWQIGFHLILERLRHAWMTSSPAALDLLTDLVYDAYKFYTDLLEDQALSNFRTAWIEALGDLARYRMVIASHVGETSRSGEVEEDVNRADALIDADEKGVSSGASIGAEVAQNWDVEDKETWRTTARDWYTMGVTEKPGEGRLHHHLGLICRDVSGQEGRALHHFTKSLTVTHAYSTSRESLLPLFDTALQNQRSQPDATAMDLFVRLHGMLFTKIELDHFTPVMSRYMERLEEDVRLDSVSRKVNVSQVDWMIMAVVNLASVLQYGTSTAVLRKALAMEGAERRKAQAATEGEGEVEGDLDADGYGLEGKEPSGPSAEEEYDGPNGTETATPPPPTFTEALHLTFMILDFALAHPTRQQGLHTVLTPYITTLLTFLATLCRQPNVVSILIPYIPWTSLIDFINASSLEVREESRLASGPPLPEDWTVRGMEWVGRRVYERGFWKAKSSGRGPSAMAQPRTGERFGSEMDVLLATFDAALDISEGVIDEVDGSDLTDGPVAVHQRRWRRVAWAVGVMIKHVEGLEVVDGKVKIVGVLREKLEVIERNKREVEVREQKEQSRREQERQKEREEEMMVGLGESEDEDDDPELTKLRERRRQLHSMLDAPPGKMPKRKGGVKRSLNAVPGYTMLVFDTNVLLSALGMFEKVVEGGQWSVIVPLPVITELDGLSKKPAPLGVAAVSAVSYLESRIRTHSLCLKIQTSKGNYLSDLLIRTEHFNFRGTPSATQPGMSTEAARTMDDLILNIAAFQLEHFVDRSPKSTQTKCDSGAVKVLLVTFDRNLRLRARGRGIDAADEKEMAAILGK